MQKKPAIFETLRAVLGPIVTLAVCIVGAWATTQGRVASLESEMKTVNDRGSRAFQDEKDKYFQQFLQIQKSMSTMEQAQKDMKDDLAEIKHRLNAK